jgi:hypothetical protein
MPANGWNLLQYHYDSRETLKRRYLKDEWISVVNCENSSISLSGLIQVVCTTDLIPLIYLGLLGFPSKCLHVQEPESLPARLLPETTPV